MNVSPPPLTDPEIETLVGRYVFEMARYEEAARLVEDRLRRALRASATRALLSSRAKHPDDLRKKLGKKRGDPPYAFSNLAENLNAAVTDLAGCRVMSYRPSDVDRIEQIVKDALPTASGEKAVERHAKARGYRATHVLVRLGDDEERMSLRGAVCEVQIVSLAAHVFNELEHDIGYKDYDGPPTEAEKRALEDLLHAARLLDSASERLLGERASSVSELKDAEALRFALERAAGRPLQGDFVGLFKLLNAVVERLTVAALEANAPVDKLLERGQGVAAGLKLSGRDDATSLALALFDGYRDEFAQLMREQTGRATLLKKAILKAADRDEQERDAR